MAQHIRQGTAMGDAMIFGLQALARLLWYLAAFQLIGSVGAYRVTSDTPDSVTWVPRIRRAALLAATATLATVGMRLLLQTYSVFGVDEGITTEGLSIVVFQTQWGTGWLWQFGASLISVALVAFAAGPSTPFLLGIAALATTATLPLTGHAVAEPWPVFSVVTQIAHVLGGGVWLGTLALLFAFMFVRRTANASLHAAWVEAFSPLALTGAALLMISGVVTTVRYVDFPSALWTTTYGWVLTGKVALVGLVVACGAYNWRRVRPRLDRPRGGVDLRRWVMRELAFAVLVLAVTSALVALPKEG